MAKDLLDQLSPAFGWDENGMWNGMTRDEVEAKLNAMKAELNKRQLDAWRLHQLAHWTPPSLPN